MYQIRLLAVPVDAVVWEVCQRSSSLAVLADKGSHTCRRHVLLYRLVPPLGSLGLSVLKCCVLKTLAFAFGLRLRSKTRCFKTRVLGRRFPNGKPQERLRFRALRSKMQGVQKTHCDHFLRFKDFPRGQGLRSGPLRSKKRGVLRLRS